MKRLKEAYERERHDIVSKRFNPYPYPNPNPNYAYLRHTILRDSIQPLPSFFPSMLDTATVLAVCTRSYDTATCNPLPVQGDLTWPQALIQPQP